MFTILEFLAIVLCCSFPGIVNGISRGSSACSCPYSKSLKFSLQQWRVSQRMVMLGRCSFGMGSKQSDAIPGDGETPVREVAVRRAFWIDKTEVTKRAFSGFVDSTSYNTTADELGTSFLFVPGHAEGSQAAGEELLTRAAAPSWWIEKTSVTWRSDYSPKTALQPVTHVSWLDALRYCEWDGGGTLPTESEWEYACRGGLPGALYPWGNTFKPAGKHMTNIWQGRFPFTNLVQDGFEALAPVGSFPANAFGLYDVVGNVWEWTMDAWSGMRVPDVKVQKGGSFMCHRMHCYRYRCGARTRGSSDSTSSNLGFRCVQHVQS